MNIRVLGDAADVAEAGAGYIADAARAAVERRGVFTLAVSGGHTPWAMLRALAGRDLPWQRVRVLQVDERVVAAGDPDRNLEHLRGTLLANAPLPPGNIYAMPVDERDLETAAARYQRTLETLAGSPPILDLVHLGLGPDGHTASLVPGDPVLGLTGSWVGITDTYQHHRRMTLTFPVLNRARTVLFVVTGDEKSEALLRLSGHDVTTPAGRIVNPNIVVLADQAAAVQLDFSGRWEQGPRNRQPERTKR